MEKYLNDLNDYVNLLCDYAKYISKKENDLYDVRSFVDNNDVNEILGYIDEDDLRDYVSDNYYVEDWVCWN